MNRTHTSLSLLLATSLASAAGCSTLHSLRGGGAMNSPDATSPGATSPGSSSGGSSSSGSSPGGSSSGGSSPGARGPTRTAASCARSLEVQGQRPESYRLKASTAADRAMLRQVLLDAHPDQFVSVPGDIAASTEGVPASWARPDGKVFLASEPLLVVRCSERYKTADVLTLDLRHISEVKLHVLDPAPKTFLVPSPPKPETHPSPKRIFELATPEEKARVPHAAVVQQQYYDCDGVGLGACQKAEAGVVPGPDYQARKEAACSTMRRKALEKCMPRSTVKRLDTVLTALQAEIVRSERGFLAAMGAKLE